MGVYVNDAKNIVADDATNGYDEMSKCQRHLVLAREEREDAKEKREKAPCRKGRTPWRTCPPSDRDADLKDCQIGPRGSWDLFFFGCGGEPFGEFRWQGPHGPLSRPKDL
jgi:hypothetical protein